MSNANELPQNAETDPFGQRDAFGTPLEIVEHVARLGDLYGSLGVDRDGTQSLIGDQLEDEALDATEDLLKAQGTTAADVLAFATMARFHFAEAIRRIPSVSGPDEEETVVLQLELADRLLLRAADTLAKITPTAPPALLPFRARRLN